jgi:methyl-accepting chemotaxis protein
MSSIKLDILKISIIVIMLSTLLIITSYIIQLAFTIQLTLLIFLLLVLIFASAVGTYVLIHLRIIQPIERLKKAQHSLLTNELKLFSVALSELARGNITININTTTAKPLRTQAYGNINDLMQQYNIMTTVVSEIINDYNSITSISCKRLCYVGADSFLEGEKCADILGSLINGSGKVAVLLNNLQRTSQIIRRKGFISLLALKYPAVEIVEVLEEFEENEKTFNLTKELVQKHPDLKGIYIAEGTTPAAAARALKDIGKETEIKIVTHDITKDTFHCLKAGTISAALSQNPYIQGYNPVIYLYNYLVTRKKSMVTRLLTALEEINTKNCDEYWRTDAGEIVSTEAHITLAKPVKNSKNQQFKIAILLPDDKIFWEPVFKGATDAAQTLREYSTVVDVIVLEKIRKGDLSVQAFSEVLEQLIAKQCQAIALPLLDKNLIPQINKHAKDGMVFATYNAESLSFRGMLNTLSSNTSHLFQVSENMAAAATQLGQAANRINNTMHMINESISHQAGQLSNTEEQINLLFDYVNNVTNKSSSSYESADKTKQNAGEGLKIIDSSNKAMGETLKSTISATEIIDTLNQNTIKIQNIIAIINDIAVRTNLIAINASILAARAGKEGTGFSVVANEIIQLADKSSHSSGDIKTIIDTILKNTQDATKIISKGMDDINKSSQLANTAFNMLDQIVTASTENKNNIEEIVELINKMKSASENVQQAMRILDEINTKNNAAIDEITISIQEISKQVIENSKAAGMLTNMASSQKDLLTQFTFEE